MPAGRAESLPLASPRLLALALLGGAAFLGPAAAAPAPFPRRHAETPAETRDRLLAECFRRLNELGMSVSAERSGTQGDWRVVVSTPGFGYVLGAGEAELLRCLEEIVRVAEAFRRKDGR